MNKQKKKSLFERYPHLLKEFNSAKNKDLPINEIVNKDSQFIYWKCKKCKKYYKSSISQRLYRKECFSCYDGERNTGKILQIEFADYQIKQQHKLWDNYKDYDHRRFCDFYLKKDNIKIVVEYDGIQHFMPKLFGNMSFKTAEKNFELQQKIDKLDKQFCEENNIFLHRVGYRQNIKKSIKKLKLRIKKYGLNNE